MVGLCLIATGSVGAVERQTEVQRINTMASSVEQISPVMKSAPSTDMLLAAEGCLAKCDRESRACDKRHIDDDGGNGDVCEQAYIQCDRACGG